VTEVADRLNTTTQDSRNMETRVIRYKHGRKS